MIKTAITIVFTLSMFCSINAQDTLRLQNRKTGRELTFVKGTRICYKLKGTTYSKTGIISNISDSSITVKNKTFSINELKKIGPRMQGADIILFGFYGITGGLFAYTINNNNYGEDHNPVATMALVTSLGITLFLEQKNSPRKINKKWVLQYHP